MTKFYEISAEWMNACGKGDKAKLVEVLSATNSHPHMTALTVDMGDGRTWTVIAEWRGRFVPAPYDLAAHAALTAAGYTYERVEAEWCETGDAENGPDMDGHPAFDLYTDANSTVMVSEIGCTLFEWRDLEMEAYVERMGVGQNGAC
jgi:hypothetical protein